VFHSFIIHSFINVFQQDSNSLMLFAGRNAVYVNGEMKQSSSERRRFDQTKSFSMHTSFCIFL